MSNLLSCRDLSKSFGDQTLFSSVSLVIAKGDRIGLIGPNGSGKSTLLKIFCGLLEPDTGELFLQKHVRVSYLAQSDIFDEQKSAAENLYDTVSGLEIEPAGQHNRVHSLLSRADLQHWTRRAYREFYLRPAYLWQQVRQTSSVGDFRVNLRGLSMLLGSIRPG